MNAPRPPLRPGAAEAQLAETEAEIGHALWVMRQLEADPPEDLAEAIAALDDARQQLGDIVQALAEGRVRPIGEAPR